MPEQTLIPTRKVAGGGVVGLAVAFIFYMLNKYVPALSTNALSPEDAAMATTILSSLAAYFIRPLASETTVQDPNTHEVLTAVGRRETRKAVEVVG